MTIVENLAPIIPDEVARAAVLASSYTKEETFLDAYKWLRANMPLGVAALEGYDPVWLVTKYQDVIDVERGVDSFHVGGENPALFTQSDDAFIRSVNGGSIRLTDSHVYMDPPEHHLVRSVGKDWFSASKQRTLVDQMRTHAKASVQQLLDTDGEADFYADFAQAYPLRVIMTQMGMPPEDEPRMQKLTQEFFAPEDPELQREEVAMEPATAAHMLFAAISDYYAYFERLSADRRQDPRDDLATLLVNSSINGAPLEERYINSYYLAAATAGHDTTAATIAGGMWGLLRHPGEWEKLKAAPAAIKPFVEESVRWSSPVRHFMRRAIADTELRGQKISAGQRLMLLFASANRDEEQFDAPDEFRIDRQGQNLGFGFGPHMCIGVHLAKIEISILWEELLPHIKSVELAGDVKLAQTNFVGGLKRLPIRFVKA